MFTFPLALFGTSVFNKRSSSFNGVDEYVEFPQPLDVAFVSQWTVSAWLNLDALNADQAIVSKWEPDGDQRTFLIRVETDNKLGAYISTAGTTIDKQYLSVNTFSQNQWYHVAVTFVSNTLRLYIDGVELTTGAGTLTKNIDGIVNSCFNSTTNTKAGARSMSGGNGAMGYLSGKLDEISYYGAALTPAQITTIYNLGKPNDLIGTPNIAHWYRMGDGDSNTTIFDKVGTSDATLINMTSSNYVADVP